jgi:FtsH-binding integral membrane protein
LLIGSFAFALLYAASISYLGTSKTKKLEYSSVRRAYLASAFALVGVSIGGIGLLIGTIGDDESWLSEGFFGGLIGALLTLLILRRQLATYQEEPVK